MKHPANNAEPPRKGPASTSEYRRNPEIAGEPLKAKSGRCERCDIRFDSRWLDMARSSMNQKLCAMCNYEYPNRTQDSYK